MSAPRSADASVPRSLLVRGKILPLLFLAPLLAGCLGAPPERGAVTRSAIARGVAHPHGCEPRAPRWLVAEPSDVDPRQVRITATSTARREAIGTRLALTVVTPAAARFSTGERTIALDPTDPDAAATIVLDPRDLEESGLLVTVSGSSTESGEDAPPWVHFDLEIAAETGPTEIDPSLVRHPVRLTLSDGSVIVEYMTAGAARARGLEIADPSAPVPLEGASDPREEEVR